MDFYKKTLQVSCFVRLPYNCLNVLHRLSADIKEILRSAKLFSAPRRFMQDSQLFGPLIPALGREMLINPCLHILLLILSEMPLQYINHAPQRYTTSATPDSVVAFSLEKKTKKEQVDVSP